MTDNEIKEILQVISDDLADKARIHIKDLSCDSWAKSLIAVQSLAIAMAKTVCCVTAEGKIEDEKEIIDDLNKCMIATYQTALASYKESIDVMREFMNRIVN